MESISTLVRGVAYKKEDATSSPGAGCVPLIRATNITGVSLTLSDFVYVPESYVSDGQRLVPGDIVIASSSGSKDVVGKAGQVAAPSWSGSFGAFCTAIRPAPQLNARFLGYYFQTQQYRRWVSDASAGSGINNLKSSELAAHVVPIPGETEQGRIVEKLDELLSDLDAGVAELRAAQKKLAKYRQSLLKAAVDGSLTASWREAQAQRQGEPQETGPQLLARILTERRTRWEAKQLAKFKEQGKAPPKDWRGKYAEPAAPNFIDLPVLPHGWAWVAGQTLFTWGSGDFLPATAQTGGDFSVYGGNGVTGRHSEANAFTATIVIGRVGVHCGNVHYSADAAWITDNAIYATSKHESISWKYAELAMTSSDLGRHAKGGAQPFISQAALNETPVPLPPLSEQIQIVEVLEGELGLLNDLSAAIDRALVQSTAQRKNILQAAFSGQLVPQDPNDEPASVLLARIRAEREARGATRARRGRVAKESA